ncbi:MAG: hypothetical protein Pg6C_00840 [Treponemataceae bacterium]|nr:MAG: hypothetical protein Pg6C_00840 [Treponemataceae bacterium]
MKKAFFFAGVMISAVLSVCGCDNLVTDLPATDTNQYIAGYVVTFPKDTKAIDIYNTVVSLYNDNEWHTVTAGSWRYIKITESADIPPLISRTWDTVSFTKIKHTSASSDPEVHTHTVHLWTSDSEIKQIVFQWQRQTTNVWQNEAIEGDITFTLP